MPNDQPLPHHLRKYCFERYFLNFVLLDLLQSRKVVILSLFIFLHHSLERFHKRRLVTYLLYKDKLA